MKKRVLIAVPVLLTLVILGLGLNSGRINWIRPPAEYTTPAPPILKASPTRTPSPTISATTILIPTSTPTPSKSNYFNDSVRLSIANTPEKLHYILTRPLLVSKDMENPLIKSSAGWVANDIRHPGVFKDKDNYHMYFTARPEGLLYRIGHAVAPSPRGPWKIDDAPALDVTEGDWDNICVSSAYVLRSDEKVYMFYSGHNGKDTRIGLAAANNPQGPFQKFSGNPFYPEDSTSDIDGLVGSAYWTGNEYCMWFGWDQVINFARAKTPQGTWRRDVTGEIRQGKPGSWNQEGVMGEAGVVNVEGIFYMFFSGFAGRPTPRDEVWRIPSDIGFAVSLDALNWYESPHNPVIKRGAGNSFDSWRLSEPGVYFENNKFYVYYTSTGPPLSSKSIYEASISLATVEFR